MLRFEGNFNKFVQSRDLVKQEGIFFRHLLRLILLLGEFAQVMPAGMDARAWQAELRDIADRLTASCREVDPPSTDEAMGSRRMPRTWWKGEGRAPAAGDVSSLFPFGGKKGTQPDLAIS